MSSANILLTRVDNRLIHRQIGVTWMTLLGANLLIVVDDDVAESSMQEKLMEVVATAFGVRVCFFSVRQTIHILETGRPSQKIFLICRTPETVRRLIDGKVPILQLDLGSMHFSRGKWSLSKKVHVNEQDMENLNYIKRQGVKIFIQDAPGDLKVEL